MSTYEDHIGSSHHRGFDSFFPFVRIMLRTCSERPTLEIESKSCESLPSETGRATCLTECFLFESVQFLMEDVDKILFLVLSI